MATNLKGLSGLIILLTICSAVDAQIPRVDKPSPLFTGTKIADPPQQAKVRRSPMRFLACLPLLLTVAVNAGPLPAAPEGTAIQELIDKLSADKFTLREDASRQLEKIGRPTLPLLRKAAREGKDLETRRRAEELIRRISTGLLRLMRTFEAPASTGGLPWLTRLTWAPDGKKAVTTSSGPVIVWDVASGKPTQTLDPSGGFSWALGVSADGKWVITGSDDQNARIWELETGKLKRELSGHTNALWGAALSANGTQAITGAADGTLKVWDIGSGRLKRSFRTDYRVRCLALSPDGKLLATGEYKDTGVGIVGLWDVEAGKQVCVCKGHTAEVTSVVLSSDGKQVLSGSFDGSVRLWEVATGKELRRYSGHAQVEAVGFLGKDRIISAGGEKDSSLRVWDHASGEELVQSREVTEGFLGLSVHAGGELVLTTGKDGLVRLWRVGR